LSDKHFDVVVLGRSIGSMCLAALLARRDFSVLVVGHGQRPATYHFREHALRRRAFAPLAATSPAFKRVMSELAQSQVFRRRLAEVDPMLGVMMPGRSFEIPPDLSLFQTEIDREFPEVRRVIDDVYVELTRVNAAADAAFEQDLVWPPGTFWERRETNSTAASLPYLKPGNKAFLGDFPAHHPYTDIILQSALFASNLAAGTRPHPSFALARLHGLWTRGPFGIPGSEDDVTDFLAERVTSLGGQVLMQERVLALHPAREKTHRLQLDGMQSVVGATFLVTDDTGESLAQLSQGDGVDRAARKDWPLTSQKAGRFTVSIVVHKGGLPAPLGAETLIFPRMPGAPPDPLCPIVRLQRTDRVIPEDGGLPSSDYALLVAEVLLATPGSLAISEARQAVLNILRSHLPFLDQHLVVVDSTHDGLPVWLYDRGKRALVDRMETRGSLRGPEPMPPLVTVEPPGYMGIGGEPVRGPIARTFLVGRSVLPSLGQEGEILAACSAARIITRSDRRRSRMRRDMWSRIEFG